MHVPTVSRTHRTALWASLLLAAALGPVQAAEVTRGSAAPGSNVRFQRLTIDEGLAQNSVLSVLQDRTGYMWLATEDGLHRYDGYGFTIFRNDPADPASLSENNVFTLLEARDGSLWVGTYNGGLSRYDPQTGTFTRYPAGPAGEGLSNGIVLALAEDRSGAIWVGTEGGLNKVEPGSGKVQRFPVGAQGTRHERIWALAVDAADRVWVGTHAGLDLYDPTTGRFTALAGGTRVKLEHSVNAITLDRSGQVWVSTEHGVTVFDRDLKQRAEYFARAAGGTLPSGRVRAILAGRSGQVWLGTIDAGLLQLDPATGRVAQFRHDPSDINSLSDDAVVSLFEDQGGVLWVGTEAQGVNRFNPATQRFQHWKSQPGNPDSLPTRMVWSVREARDGGLWVGTEAGLARIDRRTGKHRIWRHDAKDPKSLGSDYVPALYEDDAGTQWIGTNRGLQRMRADGSLERVRFEGDDAEDTQYLNSITAFARGADGRMWLGTSAGLIDYDPRSGDSRRVRSVSSDAADAEPDYVVALTPARDGGLWVGTEKGLTHLAPDGQQRRWTEGVGAGGLAHSNAQALAEDADGRLWIGTSVGLDRLDPATGTIEHLTTAQGLPNNTIYTLVFGSDGGLWMTTNRGLARLDPTTRAVRSWVVEDGLQSNEFNGGVGYASPSGWLFFGGINGLNAFRPGDLVDREFVPNAAITQVDLIDRSLSLSGALARDRHLTLGHTDPVLTFQFAVFDYAAPSKNSFRFMLEGFDTDWRESGSRNHVTYTNLDPGEYRFRLLGANTHGTWSEQEAVLSITVLPPPWRTWWAYAGYALAVLLAVALVARAHHAKVRHDHQLLAEQQKRRWSETLHQLSQSLASSLDAQQIAELLMDSLRRMLNYRTAALYVEQGVEVQLVGARGLNDEQVKALRQLPEARARLFAEIRHRREPLEVDAADLKATPLAGEPGAPMHYLAIPTFSRSEEFALLLVGRSDSPFTAQEKEIAAAVARQALVALDNARLFAELQNLATTDNLTKVNNRRYFFELAELEFARSRRYGRNLAVILLDADEFTVINEQYGHEVGDRVLRLIASTCRANLRHFDIIGRYGGEDFVIMLPETPLNVAADVADRLRKAIDGLVIETHKGELRVTVSLGVALADAEVADLATLINRADMALYEAKRSGRNRVVVAEQH